ncbi:MAG: hypothetical protein QOI82_599 [Actinomycetota bacterium]|jgi:hypothetical protein|nr:hypothetical protein [Actinomycetota bacterium]
MRKQMITLALASGLGLGGAVLAVPGIATAADSATTTAAGGLADRVTHLKQALAGLVTNGTITQAQADKVASTLAAQAPPFGGRGHGGPGGPGGRVAPETVAGILGITVDQLRTAEESGKTLTQIAATKGISKADLVSRLVAAAKTELAADVKAGRLTQAQSDQISSDLSTRIADLVDRVRPARGMHGDGDGDGPAGTPPAAPSSTTSSTTTSGASA